MASQLLNHRCTLEEYLGIEDTLECRSEYHDGEIYPMEAATVTHARLEERLGVVLERVRPPSCAIYGPSLNLYIARANKILHPDKTMICGEVSMPKPDCVDNPTLIAEVLSPKTEDYDYGTKRALYFGLASLQHYLLVSQTEAKVGVYSRHEVGWLYMERWDGDEIVLRFGQDLSAALSISEVYQGIALL